MFKLYSDNSKIQEVEDIEDISDGFHSFNEMYTQRLVLFAALCKGNLALSWRSKKHFDGSMYENYFVVGINTLDGPYTYHFHIDHWDRFDLVRVMDRAPEFDGHTGKDIERINSLSINKGDYIAFSLKGISQEIINAQVTGYDPQMGTYIVKPLYNMARGVPITSVGSVGILVSNILTKYKNQGHMEETQKLYSIKSKIIVPGGLN